MSELRRTLSTVRRPSTLLQVPSSTSTQQSASRPSSPSMLSRASRRIRDLYDGTFHDTTPEFDMVKAPLKAIQAVQLERKIPLARYNESDDEEPALSEHGLVAESLLERECQGDLLQENIDLKEQRKRMAKFMGDLEAHNERLEAKLKIAVSVWETFTGVKMTYADSPSKVHDETPPSNTPTLPNRQAGYDDDAENEALPNI